MRQAPPADAACASGGWWRGLQFTLHALACAALAAWVAGHLQAGAGLTAAAALVSASCALFWAARRPPRAGGRLRWDGQAWHLEAGVAGADPLAGHAEPLFDHGPWLLVSFRPRDGGAARWCALVDRGGGLQPVRVALYAGAAGGTARSAPDGIG